MTLRLGTLALFMAASALANAATFEIKTLNNAKDGAIMAFEPSFLKAKKGDTIKFIPKDPGHNVASVSVPKGAKPFNAEAGKPITVVLKDEGVYLYDCPLHVTMGMVGVIQVGEAKNLEETKAAGKTLAGQFVMNKDRVDKLLAPVK